MSQELYNNWIQSIFVDCSDYVEIPDELLPGFVSDIFENYSEKLSHFEDWQLGYGIDYLFNNGQSDHVFALRDGPNPLKERINAIKSISNLYRNCFQTRCQPTLGHISEPGNDLNRVCYMLWDVTPLSYCKGNPDYMQIYDAVTEVMKFAISLNNIACIESGLHGLGHIVSEHKKAKKVIQSFLDDPSTGDFRLIEYARAALIGYVL
ncbi:MAG: hypothetical protein K9M75_11490 [Phycisphaerae bacterium]|nr:hypothetical protein [Phycisphaerae bacterium]